VFIPFLVDKVVLHLPEHQTDVHGFGEFIENYRNGDRRFSVLISDLDEAKQFMRQVDGLKELADIKLAAYLCRTQPKIIETSRRRRLSESDDGDYRVYCTANILTGLLVGLILLTIAYCGFTTMMDIQIPLRTRAKELPVRKEF